MGEHPDNPIKQIHYYPDVSDTCHCVTAGRAAEHVHAFAQHKSPGAFNP